jgi:2-haloacid dehalogenase
MAKNVKAVVFDLGGVVFDPDPRRVLRGCFAGEAEMEKFFAEVLTDSVIAAWNYQPDNREHLDRLRRLHPASAPALDAYYDRFAETCVPLPGMPELIAELKSRGIKLVVFSNWAGDTFRKLADANPFIRDFDGILVSGYHGTKKPEERFHQLLLAELARLGVAPGEAVFFDDKRRNITAAARHGVPGHVFRDAATCRHLLGLAPPPKTPGRGLRP